MATPYILINNFYYYPFGNTLPRFLTEDQAFDEGDDSSLNVLILGCGDLRSVNLTAQCHEALIGNNLKLGRRLVFSLVDYEPGILARNLIVTKLFMDSLGLEDDAKAIKLETAWSIHYNHYLEKRDIDELKRTCQTLIDTLELEPTWCVFENDQTRDRVRRILLKYLEHAEMVQPKSFTKQRDQHLNERNNIAFRKADHSSFAYRCAGPRHPLPKVEKVLKDLAATYVSTGNIEKPTRTATFINPTLAYTEIAGLKYAVHYSLIPQFGYNFGCAVAKDLVSEHDFITEMKSQFGSRGLAFARMATQDRVQLRLFAGDALEFCRALFLHPRPYEFPRFSLSPISLRSDCVTRFDVIDTSNLIDHLGLLNIITHAAPFLKPTSTSRLFTDSMGANQILKPGPTEVANAFAGDATIVSALLGVVPIVYTQPFSINPLASSLIKGVPQRIHISWHRASPTVLSIDMSELVEFLSKMYLELFGAFDVLKKMELMRLQKSAMLADQLRDELHKTRYSAFGFSMILRTIFERLSLNEFERREIYEQISDNVSQRIIIQNNWEQDYMVSCHLLNLFSMEGVYMDPWEVAMKYYHARHGGYFARRGLPTITRVCILLPRSLMLGLPREKVLTPALQMSIKAASFDNKFSNLHTAWVRVLNNSNDLSTTNGWKIRCRDFDLVEVDQSEDGAMFMVSALVPTFSLCCLPEEAVTVAIEMPMLQSLPKKYLPFGILYHAKLGDRQKASIVTSWPFKGSETPPPSDKPASTNPEDVFSKLELLETNNSVVFDIRKKCMTAKVICNDLDASTKVSIRPMKEQNSAGLQLDNRQERVVQFPYPIETSNILLRVSRKSKYVEVVARLVEYDTVAPNTTFTLPRVALGLLPELKDSIHEKKLIQDALSMAVKNSSYESVGDVLRLLFSCDPYTVISVHCESSKTATRQLVFIPIGIRLDFINGSPCLECAVALSETNVDGKIVTVSIEIFEFLRRLVVTSIERCRSNYQHSESCSSLENDVCSCGNQLVPGEARNACPVLSKVLNVAAIPLLFDTAMYIEQRIVSGTRKKYLLRLCHNLGIGAATKPQLVQDLKSCGECKGEQAKLKCSRCSNIYYCSKNCQVKHWPMHKKSCGSK